MKKKLILPALAALAAIAALIVVLVVPKGGVEASPYAEKNSDGNYVIRKSTLSSDAVSFIRLSEDSKIELLARIGEDGGVKLALGTCQSCNGSPLAYYTQSGDSLICNNCSLSFPLSVLDSPGGGCHPIMIDSSIIEYTNDGAVLDASALSRYEYLFEKVAAH